MKSIDAIDNYKQFFEQITSKKPYNYQINAAINILEGKNLIVQEPTGSGKTLSTVIPFIYGFSQKKRFADKLIYVLPLRVLANNLFLEIKKIIINSKIDLKPTLSIQTGENPFDKYWDSDIIFMTLDQLLAGYLTIPSGLSRKQDNIIAGALCGACVILDEFHMFDPDTSMRTTFELINRMQNFTQFILVTATLTSNALTKIKMKLNAVKIEISKEELAQIKSQAEKKRTFILKEEQINVESILKNHHKRTIVLCNTVDKAQKLYQEIRSIFEKSKIVNIELILLHSRFLHLDRVNKEIKLTELFGPDSNENSNAILISTQVIEVGIDISADILHTEIAPANSIIQRAGRCARYNYPRNVGTVFIYDLEYDSKSTKRYGPYFDQKEIIDDSFTIIKFYSGLNIDFLKEREIIDKVHTNQEERSIQSLTPERTFIQETIDIFENHSRSARTSHIRDIDSLNVLILKNCDKFDLNFEIPDSISIPRISLKYGLKKISEINKVNDYIGQYLEYNENKNDPEMNGFYNWKQTNNIENLLSSMFIIINPKFAFYSPDIGFVLIENQSNLLTPINILRKKESIQFNYECESFFDHSIKTALKCFEYIQKINIGLKKWQKKLDLPDNLLEKIMILCATFHDLGKLQVTWQNPIQEWQQQIDPNNKVYQLDKILAHSTYNSKNHYSMIQPHRSPHSLEGALISAPFFMEFLKENSIPDRLSLSLLICIFTAIGHHHNPNAKNISKFKTIIEFDLSIKKILLWLSETFKIHIETINFKINCEDQCYLDAYMKKLLLNFNQTEEFIPFYWFVVRIIRLSDNNSFNIREPYLFKAPQEI